ncbi:uncharacterized protein tmem79a [Neolamprologus brichardi]|uniref:Retrotransposon-like protein 1-like n=1 Tax=Neolamprologus brichardi TaxID=32507 RepID=A0A3Q4HDZ5_NEOBR|nr:uncharacterized protein tmem79a [Neolamprologus brichardi]
MADLINNTSEELAFSPAGSSAEPQTPVSKKPQEHSGLEDKRKLTDEEEEEEEDDDATSSAFLEPSTLPWSADRNSRALTEQDDGISSEKGGSELDERDTGISRGSQDLSEEQSQEESDVKSKTKWRESMPEGERWRDDEIKVKQGDKEDGSLADDEDEEEEDEGGLTWVSEKSSPGFTPQVTILNHSTKEVPEVSRPLGEKEVEPEMEHKSVVELYPEWTTNDDKYYLCEHICKEKLRVVLAMVAAAILFPFLVWGGYALIPFDSPKLESAPLRVVYTLRCAFFASVPILLGVVVQGLARLRYSAVKPLVQSNLLNIQVAVHWHYVNESLGLFLFYFLQLAVMATYISQDLIKLVPLLTIVFVFGRLIYWLCLSLGSSTRGFGFGFSFFPILVMLGTNLYFVCSSMGQDSVFDVAPPTSAPPPRQRWWG